MKNSFLKRIFLILLLGCFLISSAQANPNNYPNPRKYLEKKLQSFTHLYIPPQVLRTVTPKYTPYALEEGIEGEIILYLKINKIGQVTEARIIKGLGYGLDEAAKAAALKWVFRPATRAGLPAPGRKRIAMRFVLQ